MIALTSDIPTWAHPLPAGAKLAALAAATVAIVATGLPGAVAGLVAGGALYASGGRAFALSGLRRLRGIALLAALIALWHGLTGAPLTGVMIACRLIAVVMLAGFVTMTTRLDAMLAVFAAILRRVGLPAALRARVALALALAVRFIPVLSDKGARLSEAWRARSPRRPSWRIVLPMALLAIDDAEQVAEALRARGGAADEPRTP